MNIDIHEKKVIITGAGSGIGKSLCMEFLKEGALVAALDNRLDKLKALNKEIKYNKRLKIYEVDVSEYSTIEETVKNINLDFKKIDILINCAGINITGSITNIKKHEFEKVININLIGIFNMCKNVLDIMEKQGDGVIINFASRLATSASPNNVAYCTAKGGILQLTRQMAIDYAQKGIRINAISPGLVNTPLISNGKDFNYNLENQKKGYPMKRFAETNDISGMVLFLCSDKASYITGSNVVIDGGRSVL